MKAKIEFFVVVCRVLNLIFMSGTTNWGEQLQCSTGAIKTIWLVFSVFVSNVVCVVSAVLAFMPCYLKKQEFLKI